VRERRETLARPGWPGPSGRRATGARRWAAAAVAAGVLAACGGPADVTADGDPDPDPVDDGAVEEPVAPDDDADPDAAAPEPDPAALADPCATHEGREMEQFIDVVAPVEGQRVGDEVELVGCANVHEATVSFRLSDGSGRTLDEGFTTATCGTGCVGTFRETLDLSVAAGEPAVTIEVFTVSMADDGGEEELTAVTVVPE
jgi:hypothetical protein